MEASSVLQQVMSTHSLEEVLGCAKQASHQQQQQQQQQQQMLHNHHSPSEQAQHQQVMHGHHSPSDQQQAASDPSKRLKPQPEQALRCPRCDSTNTKFCYYNNYSLSQPRYFCKGCRRYWTQGGTLRNVPVGGGCRKKRPSSAASAAVAAKLNKIHVVASAASLDHHSPVPTPDPATSPLHLTQSAPASTLGYDPSDLSLAFARLQQKSAQQHDHAAAFLHLLPGSGGVPAAVSASMPASCASSNGFLDFLRGGSGFLDVAGGAAFCNPYSSGFSGSGLVLGGAGDNDGPLLPIGEVGTTGAGTTTPPPAPAAMVKQEGCGRGVLDGGDAKGMMAMMGFHHHQWAPHHQQQLPLQHPFISGGGSAAAASGVLDAGFGSGLGGAGFDYWSNLGPAASWHGLVNSSLI